MVHSKKIWANMATSGLPIVLEGGKSYSVEASGCWYDADIKCSYMGWNWPVYQRFFEFIVYRVLGPIMDFIMIVVGLRINALSFKQRPLPSSNYMSLIGYLSFDDGGTSILQIKDGDILNPDRNCTIKLGPNDHSDRLFNNSGHLKVEIKEITL